MISITHSELSDLVDAIAERVADRLANQPRLVDRHTMARMLSISVASLDRRVKDGSIPSIKDGSRRLFDPADVTDAVKKNGGNDE